MNNYICLSLIISFAAFGASYDDSKLNGVLDAVRQNDTTAVLNIGKNLSNPEKKALASDREFLTFICRKIDSHEISRENKEQFLGLFPFVGNPIGPKAIRTGNTVGLRAYLAQEDLHQNKETEHPAPSQEKTHAALRDATDLDTAITAFTADQEKATAFNETIKRYHESVSCEERDSMIEQIRLQALALRGFDKKIIHSTEGPFVNLITDLIGQANIHALRQIKNILEETQLLPTDNDLYTIILDTVNVYEDGFKASESDAAYNQITPQHQTMEERLDTLATMTDAEALLFIRTLDPELLDAILQTVSHHRQKPRLDNLILQHQTESNDYPELTHPDDEDTHLSTALALSLEDNTNPGTTGHDQNEDPVLSMALALSLEHTNANPTNHNSDASTLHPEEAPNHETQPPRQRPFNRNIVLTATSITGVIGGILLADVIWKHFLKK